MMFNVFYILMILNVFYIFTRQSVIMLIET